jgi:hypothetical protein
MLTIMNELQDVARLLRGAANLLEVVAVDPPHGTDLLGHQVAALAPPGHVVAAAADQRRDLVGGQALRHGCL